MNTGIVLIYRDEYHEILNKLKMEIENFNEEHLRIYNKLFNHEIIFEKDNSAIQDVLSVFKKVPGRYIRECDKIVEDVCIGYCIIPIGEYDLP